MNCMLETAIACALLGTPAAFIAGGFPIRQSVSAGLLVLLMLVFFYCVSVVGHAIS